MGRLADPEALAAGLNRLAYTADEVKAVAKKLSTGKSDIIPREKASENTFKS